MILLEVKGLTKNYIQGELEVRALDNVSLTVEQGQFVSIMGPSGSGKSTLLHLIGGLDKATAGSVRIAGSEINTFDDKKLSEFRRRRLGFIFQFFNLLPTMTALENVALPLLLDGQSMSEVAPQAMKLLESFGMARRASHTPDQLSGGEMQRVAIARALVTNPVLILADEPTGNLDSKTGQSVLEILSAQALERKQTIVMVTHSSEAARFAHRQIVMRDGNIQSDA